MKKIWFFLGLCITFYLILPGPRLPPPDLPQSFRSTEPGDTVQLPRISAYFTDKTRDEVLSFYTNYFARSPFLNFPLITYRLNHPPEYAKQVVRETTRSYYLEEVVHPLRESLFINGFEWEKDVFTQPKKRIKNKILVEGKVWRSKVTLRWFVSHWGTRLMIFWSAWLMLFIVFQQWYREIKLLIEGIKKTSLKENG